MSERGTTREVPVEVLEQAIADLVEKVAEHDSVADTEGSAFMDGESRPENGWRCGCAGCKRREALSAALRAALQGGGEALTEVICIHHSRQDKSYGICSECWRHEACKINEQREAAEKRAKDAEARLRELERPLTDEESRELLVPRTPKEARLLAGSNRLASALADAERERDEARLDRDRINSQMLVEREEAAASAVTLGSALSASQDLVRRMREALTRYASSCTWPGPPVTYGQEPICPEHGWAKQALGDSPAPPQAQHVCGLSGYNGMLDPPCPGPGHHYEVAPPIPEGEKPERCPRCLHESHLSAVTCPMIGCGCNTEYALSQRESK